MENMKKETCMQCKEHCPVDALQCGKGKKYFESLQAEDNRGRHGEGREGHEGRGRHGEGRGHKEQADDSLTGLLCRCGYIAERRGGRHRGQKRILQILVQSPRISQKELTERLNIEPGSMSEVLAKLEDKGFIQREKDADDRRKMLISLTGKGQNAAMQGSDSDADESMLDVLSEEEKETLKKILQKLLEHWKTERKEQGNGRHRRQRG